MNARHLHVTTPVLTLRVVLCVPVVVDMNWLLIDYPVMVGLI